MNTRRQRLRRQYVATVRYEAEYPAGILTRDMEVRGAAGFMDALERATQLVRAAGIPDGDLLSVSVEMFTRR